MGFELEFTLKFSKQYDKKTPDEKERVEKAIELLADNPYHPGLHSHKVQGTYGIFECYIDNSHRITYEYGKDCIVLRNNCNHDITDKSP
jgi:mRNA interferase RelE/StbE